MKDNFSSVSKQYAKFRPHYPAELFVEISNLVKRRESALDVGTGNGQFAVQLAKYFDKVTATDISKEQIQHAIKNEKINYSVQRAEETEFEDNSFDLISVAQAIHWFDFDRFYNEVRRTIRNNGILAATGYGMPKVNEEVDRIVADFYEVTTGPYWDEERRYIDAGYKTIPFPFEEINLKPYAFIQQWNVDQFIGYLGTWSGVNHYLKAKGENPLDLIHSDLKKSWKDVQAITFPIITRVGRVYK
ncbi:MAG: class I SAM-dependent methyltransferase [Bacteroidota bacterium]